MISFRNAAAATFSGAMIALFTGAAAPVFAQAPASASDTSFTASQDWRVVIVADNGRFLHCAAITTGPAGDLRLSKLNGRDWAIAVPAGGRRGNVRANVGSEQMTLQADGQRAWWVIPNAPFWGDSGQEESVTVDLNPANSKSQPMEWMPRGAADAVKEVERCHAQNAAPRVAQPPVQAPPQPPVAQFQSPPPPMPQFQPAPPVRQASVTAAYCTEYGNLMVGWTKKALQARCPGWPKGHLNGPGHATWCMGQPLAAVENAKDVWGARLDGCLTSVGGQGGGARLPAVAPQAQGNASRHPVCSSFAKHAERWDNAAKGQGCRIRNDQSERQYYDWCMTNSDAEFRQRSAVAAGHKAGREKECSQQMRRSIRL